MVIIQNDVGNRFSPTVIVAMSTAQDKNTMPTHYEIRLFEPSTIMLEQLRTIDKRRLTTKIRDLTPAEISEINKRLKISLELE